MADLGHRLITTLADEARSAAVLRNLYGSIEFGYVAIAGPHDLDQRPGTVVRILDADGFLFVVGRSDDMIVCGGENVFPAEIDECLRALFVVATGTTPEVDDSAITSVPG